MKQCPNCSEKNQDTVSFCVKCGADLRTVAVTPDGWSAVAGDMLKRAGDTINSGANAVKGAASAGAKMVKKAVDQANKQAEKAKAKGVASGGWDTAAEISYRTPSDSTPAQKGGGALIDPGETVVAAIGSSYLQSFLSGGRVSKGVGVLTEKRFYYKGRNLSGTGSKVKRSVEEGVVSLEDITFTRFTHNGLLGMMILAILLAVAGAACLLIGGWAGAALVVGLFLLGAAALFLLIYFVTRSSVFLVAFPGGGFAFNVHDYPAADIRDFQRQLHLLKDRVGEGART